MPLSHCLDWWAEARAFRIYLTASPRCRIARRPLGRGVAGRRMASQGGRALSWGGDVTVEGAIRGRAGEIGAERGWGRGFGAPGPAVAARGREGAAASCLRAFPAQKGAPPSPHREPPSRFSGVFSGDKPLQ